MKPLSAVLASFLTGCAATGPLYGPPEAPPSGHAQVVVYRISQVGGTAGTWVPTRLEVNESAIRKLPADAFVAFTVPAGDITLSATDMVNFRYADKHRMTLRVSLHSGETAYFRIVSVLGEGCAAVVEKAGSGVLAYATHHPRPDWAQTSCFERVPEALALRELKRLRRAD